MAKSLESERKSGQSTAIAIILIVLVIFGIYWFAVRASSSQEEVEKQTDEHDEDGYHPTEEDYEYMDDDDFDDEDDIDDEDYDLLEEDPDDDADSEAEDDDADFEAEEDDDVRISDILNETRL